MEGYINDRRSSPRHRVNEYFLVFDARGSVGRIVDISMGGIAFESIYTIESGEYDNSLGMILDKENHVDQIAFRIASVTSVPNEFPFSRILVNRYGVEFSKLTPRQKSRLQTILQQLRNKEAQAM